MSTVLAPTPAPSPGPTPGPAPGTDAAAIRLEVRHETTYRYAQPVALAHHVAHLEPLDVHGQRRMRFGLDIDPAPAHLRAGLDAWGNRRTHFSIERPHEALVVVATTEVVLEPRFLALEAEASPPVAAVAHRLRYVAGTPFVPAMEFTLPSPYVPHARELPELRRLGAGLLAPERPVAAAAIELMHRLHAEFRYESRSTEIDTPLAQVIRQKRGVCQDFAHLMVGVLRAHGLAARYVSGYLLTHAVDGSQPLLGADASHAWVQVWCPDTPGVGDGWLGLDPTNDCVPATGHVRVATGRDYGDVAPLRGVIRGGGAHTLAVGVTTRRLPAPTAQAPDLLSPDPKEPSPP